MLRGFPHRLTRLNNYAARVSTLINQVAICLIMIGIIRYSVGRISVTAPIKK